MSAIRITGLSGIAADLKQLEGALRRSNAIFKAAADARNMIQQRNLSGRDMNGRPFKPYSTLPIYIDINSRPKPKGGRRRHEKTGKPMKRVFYEGGYAQFAAQTKGSVRPNLFASGDMMRAFQAQKISSKKAQVGFTRRHPAEKAIANSGKRPFVGLTARETDKINRIVGKIIDKEIRKAGF